MVAKSGGVVARVFVSHASEDILVACELHRWLVASGHEVFLDQNLRDGIAVGEEWEKRLQERLRWANAMVCVVTSAYSASSWCLAEVSLARSRGNRLLPVRAEPGVTHALLKSIQHADLTRDQVTAYAALTEALRRIDEVGDPDWPDDRSPFPGLRPFDIEDHRVFFARTHEVEQLAELLRSTAERAEGAVLLVVGPSGCGKSSLLRAGLLPVMAGEPGWWTLPAIVPGSDPMAALVRELAAASQEIGLDWPVGRIRNQLDEGNLTGLVEELLTALGSPAQRLLVVVDQFEELLVQAGPADRARFAELLRPALTGPVQVVGTLRPEFLDRLLSDSALAALSTDIYPLRPLNRDGLRLVIEQPARLAGIAVEERLVARMVNDTDSGDALPLLAFTLAELADGISRGGQLSTARYRELGGVQGALIRQADAALAEATAGDGRSREEVIAGLMRLITVDEQGRPTRWRVLRDELPAAVIAGLDPFVARRLVITDIDTGGVVIGVAHEAFLSAWPPLTAAITASSSALRARRLVEHAATEWDQDGRAPVRLWERGQLAAALADTGAQINVGSRFGRLSDWWPQRHRMQVTNRVELSATARAFLQAGVRRDRRRRGRATTILSSLLILALAAAVVAFIQRQATLQQLQVATARQLLAQADATRDADPRTALLLGIAAQRIHPDAQTRASLVTTLTTTRYAGTLIGEPSAVRSVVFSPDGHTLAAVGNITTVLWDLANPAGPIRRDLPLNKSSQWAQSVAFSPDGRTLATGDFGSTVTLWDLTDRTRPTEFGSLPTSPNSPVAFSPDGRTLATGGSDGPVRLWGLTDRTRSTKLGSPPTGQSDSISSVMVFSPDGRTLATTNGQTVMLWDVTDRARATRLGPPLTGHTGPVYSVAFSPDGRTLATAEKTVILWDLTDPTKPTRRGSPLTGHTNPISSVAFSPDGRTLATVSAESPIILWDLTDPTGPTRRGSPLTGHTGPISSVAFSPDGRILASGGLDARVILWDLTDRTRPAQLGPPLTGHTDKVLSAVFSPDGRTLATRSGEMVILWDLTDRSRPARLGAPLTRHTGAAYYYAVAFSADGRTLATTSGETVMLWDLTDRTKPTELGPPLTGHSYPVYTVTFSPDGRTLATTSEGATFLWDITDRTRPTRRGLSVNGYTTSTSRSSSPDGRTEASIDGSMVILSDIIDATRPTKLGPPLTGHDGPVQSAVFSPDGRTLATAAKTVILWDLTDRTRPARLGPPLTGHTDAVSSVAFSPDGRTLVTTSLDKTAVLWDLTGLNDVRDHAIEHACSIVGRGLDREEWNRYVPGLVYQNTCLA
jgi:WD40 repeat protein/energy-coupling factor transporter ATP-binding protein EcfA2